MRLRPLTRWTARTPRRRLAASFSALGAIVGVGTLDWNTGSELSFAAFYVLIVVTVTVVAGPAIGMLAALTSAVTWGVADAITGRNELLGVQLWNGLVRFVVHGIVVLLMAALLRALTAARESEALSRSFLAAAAHQLRTPVAAVGASVEALLLEGATPEQERLLANVAGETSRLGRLVGALLRTARLDQGEPLRHEWVDVVGLCERELDRVRQFSVLEWRLVRDVSTPRQAVLDADATRESLANLLDNAGRHASETVEVTIWAEKHHVFVQVADDGPGLPAGAEEQAFDRFVTFDGRGGTGLGLAIARDLARRQAGDLVYDRKAFVLSLPLGEDARNARDSKLADPLSPRTGPPRGARVAPIER